MRPSSSPKRTANRAIEAFTPKALILNHELRQRFIIGDIGIGKAGRIQPFEKPVKLLGLWFAKGSNGDFPDLQVRDISVVSAVFLSVCSYADCDQPHSRTNRSQFSTDKRVHKSSVAVTVVSPSVKQPSSEMASIAASHPCLTACIRSFHAAAASVSVLHMARKATDMP